MVKNDLLESTKFGSTGSMEAWRAGKQVRVTKNTKNTERSCTQHCRHMIILVIFTINTDDDEDDDDDDDDDDDMMITTTTQNATKLCPRKGQKPARRHLFQHLVFITNQSERRFRCSHCSDRL